MDIKGVIKMSELQKNMVDYFVICVNEFAKRYNMGVKDAMLYLEKYNGKDSQCIKNDLENLIWEITMNYFAKGIQLYAAMMRSLEVEVKKWFC